MTARIPFLMEMLHKLPNTGFGALNPSTCTLPKKKDLYLYSQKKTIKNVLADGTAKDQADSLKYI